MADAWKRLIETCAALDLERATIWMNGALPRQKGARINRPPSRAPSASCAWAAASALAIEGCLAPIALDVHFEDCGVVYQSADSRQRHGLVGEDATPLAELLIGRDQLRPLAFPTRSSC